LPEEPRRCVPIFQNHFQERKWLTKHGNDKYIPFKDEQIVLLRQYFSELDDDGSGSIGVKELEDPLIALGLSQSRDEVQKMIEEVDEDESGKIEFD
jgi:Ca2+-binding EF-hand superfamily protein